jgi:hypothetical protein
MTFSLRKNSVHPKWDERCCIRGATQFKLAWIKKSRCDATGASFTHSDTAKMAYILAL